MSVEQIQYTYESRYGDLYGVEWDLPIRCYASWICATLLWWVVRVSTEQSGLGM